jgi:hypothetical protein
MVKSKLTGEKQLEQALKNAGKVSRAYTKALGKIDKDIQAKKNASKDYMGKGWTKTYRFGKVKYTRVGSTWTASPEWTDYFQKGAKKGRWKLKRNRFLPVKSVPVVWKKIIKSILDSWWVQLFGVVL